MSGDVTLLSEIVATAAVVIDLPNEAQTSSNKQGVVALHDGTKIKNVLFVSKLSCNLVLVAKVTRDLNCSVTCFDDHCVLYDRILRTPIRAGEQQDGVYYYGRPSSKR